MSKRTRRTPRAPASRFFEPGIDGYTSTFWLWYTYVWMAAFGSPGRDRLAFGPNAFLSSHARIGGVCRRVSRPVSPFLLGWVRSLASEAIRNGVAIPDDVLTDQTPSVFDEHYFVRAPGRAFESHRTLATADRARAIDIAVRLQAVVARMGATLPPSAAPGGISRACLGDMWVSLTGNMDEMRYGPTALAEELFPVTDDVLAEVRNEGHGISPTAGPPAARTVVVVKRDTPADALRRRVVAQLSSPATAALAAAPKPVDGPIGGQWLACGSKKVKVRGGRLYALLAFMWGRTSARFDALMNGPVWPGEVERSAVHSAVSRVNVALTEAEVPWRLVVANEFVTKVGSDENFKDFQGCK